MRHILKYPSNKTLHGVEALIPTDIELPSFQKSKLKRIDPELTSNYVILGSTQEALAAIYGIRHHYQGKIIVIPSLSSWNFKQTSKFFQTFNPTEIPTIVD